MIRVEVDVSIVHAHLLAEGLALAGDQVGHRDDLDVRELYILFDVGFRDPTGADDADAQLPAGVNLFFFRSLGELAQNRIAVCH